MNHHQLSPSSNILIVDDIADNLRVLSASLSERGYRVRCVKNGAMALFTVGQELPDLILLDIKMPDMDGYQVCIKLKENELTKDIPIIFLSALDDVFDKVKAFRVGGVDYITKPFQTEEIVVRIQHQLTLQAAKTEILQLNRELEQLVSQLNQEITQHQQTQSQLSHQALHDALTGLPNRTLFMEHLQKAIQRHQRNQDYLFAVLFIDLDRFKIINDSWGYAVGDRLLIAIAGILQECCRELDTVARWSGDEFTILLEDLQNLTDGVAISERILARLTAPIDLEERKIYSGASIGIVCGGTNYDDGVELLRDADIAMYRAKVLGRGRYALFDCQMYAQTLHLSQLETDLHLALERQEFILNYQPIISLTTFKLIGFEALLRWHHPIEGSIPPGEFIPLAEETGLIVPIGEWVLREACRQLRTWQSKFSQASSLYISINLSSKQIKQLDFVDKLTKILTDTGLDGRHLRLELTETMLMDRGEKTIELLHQIKRQKVQLSIDDFGTGYSSLSYLHRFPIDTLKIDRSFVSSINMKGKNCEIVRTIITLAHSLGMKAIAEGVETPHQVTYLRNFGCEAAQGYLFAKPLDLKLAEAAIVNNSTWY
jgi:diguanylate cyclase (GGDEF)-like protein